MKTPPNALPEVLDALPQFGPALRMIRASVRRSRRLLAPRPATLNPRRR